MRILCLSAPLPGHLDWGGYLATALELQRRGHQVLWASGKAVGQLVRQLEIPFQPLVESGWRWPPPPPLTPLNPAAATNEDWQRIRAERALDQWLDPERVAAAVTEIYGLVERWKPDLILSEMFIAAAGLVAEMAMIPLLIAGWPAQDIQLSKANPTVEQARQRLETLLQRFALLGNNWSKSGPPALLSPHLHLSYWSQRWFSGLPMLAQTRHFGGIAPSAEPSDPSLPPSEDRPWVLITLGTSFGNDPNFFVSASHAATQLGCLPILALGNQITGDALVALKKRLPPESVIRQQINFRALLPYTAAAIHHGGAGTTHALVTRAVPQIVVPHAADQQRQAHGVMRSGVGLAFAPKDVTSSVLADGLAALLPDLSDWRATAAQVRDEFAALGGVAAAAQSIEKM